MNIREFKGLVAALPDEFEAGDLNEANYARLWQFFEEFKEAQRQACEDELVQALNRIKTLQARLGQSAQPQAAAPAPAPARAARQPEGDFTDYDLGIGEDHDGDDGGAMTMGAFQSELAEARASGAAKRRRLS